MESGRASRGGRVMRVAAFAAVVFGVEWRFADPLAIAADPTLWATPYAMLFLCVPVALGVWTYSVTAVGEPGIRVDALWGVLVGTLGYVGLTFLT